MRKGRQPCGCEYGAGGAFEGACVRHAIVRSAQWHGHRTDGVGAMVHDGDGNEVALNGPWRAQRSPRRRCSTRYTGCCTHVTGGRSSQTTCGSRCCESRGWRTQGRSARSAAQGEPWRICTCTKRSARPRRGVREVGARPLRGDESDYDFYSAERIRFEDKAKKDVITSNSRMRIEGIPRRAYNYVVNGRSAVE